MSTVEIIGLCMGIFILLVMLIGAFITSIKDKKKWNKGVCDSCYDGVWISTACDSGGCSLWNCTNCGTSWWESGYGSKKELNPDASQELIRSMKLKKLRRKIGNSSNITTFWGDGGSLIF